MKKLQKLLNPDVFDDTGDLDKDIINEFYERSERKREDEAWLNKHKPLIKDAMFKLGKNISAVGDKRVVITEVDSSKFDLDKVLAYLQMYVTEPEVMYECTKVVVNEDGLEKAIEAGLINLDDLKHYAWVSSKGTSRVTIKKNE
jgi:hypothetical protein